MRFKKFLSTVCASALLFSSIFCCKAEGSFEYRVAFVGDSKTGKTSIFKRLKNQNFREYEAQTISVEFHVVDSGGIKLQIWDPSAEYMSDTIIKYIDTYNGEVSYNLLQVYLEHVKIVGIFLDVSKDNYTERLDYWLKKVNEVVPDSKKIIVLSKTDLPEVSSKLEAAKQEIRGVQNDIPENQIISCSAKTNTGVDTLKNCMFALAQSLPEYQQYQQEQRQQEELRQKRRKNLTIGSLVTAGIVAIGYGARAVYKRLTSNDKDKNVNAYKLKKNYKQTKVTA